MCKINKFIRGHTNRKKCLKAIKKDLGTSPSYRTVCPCGTRIVPRSWLERIETKPIMQALN